MAGTLVIHIQSGFHIRPVMVLCNRAMDFQSEVLIKIREKTVNAKSMLGVLSAGIREGDEIELICTGPDEKEALEILSGIIRDGLKEETRKKS